MEKVYVCVCVCVCIYIYIHVCVCVLHPSLITGRRKLETSIINITVRFTMICFLGIK